MSSPKIVITGGRGYLGGVTARLLKSRSYDPILLARSMKVRPVPQLSFKEVHEVDLTDLQDCERVFARLGPVHSIMHFAGYSDIAESIVDPWKYFNNNINAAMNVAECASKFKIPFVILSSSSTVYGIPSSIPVSEEFAVDALSPYGESKSIVEGIFRQFARWKNIRVLSLRYFNPAGIDLETGSEDLLGANVHLISNLIRSAENESAIDVFGTDFPTPDGTSIRDYMHVSDLAEAQILGLKYLENHPQVTSEVVNIGTGVGVSVKELIEVAERVFSAKLKVNYLPRRPGDPAELVADISKMRNLFKWRPTLGLEDIVRDQWRYQKSVSKLPLSK